jgi:hypothetical protein
MSQWRTCACVLGVLLLTGCTAASAAEHVTGHPAAGPARATGHVTGTLLIEGGPIGPGGQQPGERPIPGTVTFTAAGHRSMSIQVGNSGTFSVRLSPGRYQISAKSPRIIEVDAAGHDHELPCSQPLSVTVKAGHPAAITIACIVP